MPQATPFSKETFSFLSGLAKNNNRDWFNDNKQRFKDHVEAPFINMLEGLAIRLQDAERPLTGGKSTLFRLNRDVRFTEDKSPYKTTISGLLTPSGTKSELAGVVYLQLGATGGFSIAGYYNLKPKQLGPMRDAMIERAEAFDQVLSALSAAGRRLDDSMTLSSMPKGFTEHSDHRHADVIKLKSLMVREDLPKKTWLSGEAVDRVEKLARDCMPLLRFAEPAR